MFLAENVSKNSKPSSTANAVSTNHRPSKVLKNTPSQVGSEFTVENMKNKGKIEDKKEKSNQQKKKDLSFS